MKKIIKNILLITLLSLPTIVLAEAETSAIPNGINILVEAFVTIHMSIFVLLPLSKIFGKEKSKSLFWTLFILRIVFLMIINQTSNMAFIIDFFAVFIGAFIIVPISALITKTSLSNVMSNQKQAATVSQTNTLLGGLELHCTKCNALLQITDKVCGNCGEPFDGNNVSVVATENVVVPPKPKERIFAASYNQIYSLPEDQLVEAFIKKELEKAGISTNNKLMPANVLKRKKVLNIIFAMLVFIYVSMIFFHFPITTYIVGFIILLVYFILTRKYKLVKYLKKQLTARPSEKVSNIVMSIKETFLPDNTKVSLLVLLLIAIIAPLFIFYNPRIIYEEKDDGYAVRYYIYGLTNNKTATIPETYKGKKVIGLRGNTFSNMIQLESVVLPDTITEIRGQAFKNCYNLVEVNIPKNLEYLGGGAFYNAISITKIELPDTLTHLGGESFYNAEALKSIKLSANLTEIRGNSFENCISLTSIAIPDKVTRIGGHAFYGNTNLSEVIISPNSELKEIGSSAFRRCYKLESINLPRDTYVDMRAFKESPTQIHRYS